MKTSSQKQFNSNDVHQICLICPISRDGPGRPENNMVRSTCAARGGELEIVLRRHRRLRRLWPQPSVKQLQRELRDNSARRWTTTTMARLSMSRHGTSIMSGCENLSSSFYGSHFIILILHEHFTLYPLSNWLSLPKLETTSNIPMFTYIEEAKMCIRVKICV